MANRNGKEGRGCFRNLTSSSAQYVPLKSKAQAPLTSGSILLSTTTRRPKPPARALLRQLVCIPSDSKAAPIDIIRETHQGNLGKAPRGHRFSREAKAYGYTLYALAGSSAYQKISMFLNGGIPRLRTIKKMSTPLAPALDGFNVLQAARMWGYFAAMIKLTDKLDSIEEAEARLRSRPFVSISEDATAIRAYVAYNSEYDQVAPPPGFSHLGSRSSTR